MVGESGRDIDMLDRPWYGSGPWWWGLVRCEGVVMVVVRRVVVRRVVEVVPGLDLGTRAPPEMLPNDT